MAKATVNQFKVGNTVKVVGNTAGHGSSIGDIVTITRISYPSIWCKTSSGQIWTYNRNDLKIAACSKKDLESNIKEFEAEIKAAKLKIKFIEDTGSEEFDEDEFKIYNALTVLDGAKSKIEKARILKDIING